MILGNRSPKGIFGQIMSVFPHGSLASVSRSQRSESFLILRVDSSKFKSKFNLLLLKNVIVKEMKVKKRVRTIAHKQACCFKQNRVEREGFTVQRMSLNQNTLLLLKKHLDVILLSYVIGSRGRETGAKWSLQISEALTNAFDVVLVLNHG